MKDNFLFVRYTDPQEVLGKQNTWMIHFYIRAEFPQANGTLKIAESRGVQVEVERPNFGQANVLGMKVALEAEKRIAHLDSKEASRQFAAIINDLLSTD